MEDGQLEIEDLGTTEESSAAPAETTEAPAVEAAAPPEQSEEQRAEAEAAAALASEKGEEGEAAPKPYQSTYKFSASQKEHDIPEFLRGVIKDEKTEKELKTILSKAYGSDLLIEKNKKLEGNFTESSKENTNIKGAINDLRQVFADATKPGGNILKLDQWLEKLMIPEETMLQWAVAKVKLMEMPPEQRNAIVAQMNAEKRAAVLNQEQQSLQGQNMDSERRLKSLELQSALMSPDVQRAAQRFDKITGKAGSFEEAVRTTGSLAWFKDGINLPTNQAVSKVIEQYGLNALEADPAPATMGATAPQNGQTRQVVQRTDRTIPNVAGKANQSPLKQKPRSIDDIKKLAARAAAGESV